MSPDVMTGDLSASLWGAEIVAACDATIARSAAHKLTYPESPTPFN